MIRFKQAALAVTCLVFLLISCKNNSEKNKKEIEKELKLKIKKVEQPQKKPRKFLTGERKKYEKAKKENLDVLEGESYFNIKDEYVLLKIPVANEDFRIYNAFNIQINNKKAILITITDKTPVSIKGTLGNFILEEKILFSNFIGESLKLNKNDKLEVIIINDDSIATKTIEEIKSFIKDFDLYEDKIKLNNFEPSDKGGGVINPGP
ncbi:hypothetical protein FDT66_04970 [Polaribacter aestuariivivens]|uniref:Lipoprotein n=1 Tax=Polaribacter aestuariivivens TaxID=2304626 RepID=A0A5S3N7P7_9FLAO|nr:hypothetical protein [Polaribacter aestuariivivens]TMM31321.1 hypothetical protein FDT66_04970 [Polaribacter aestuariivivens]